MGTVKTLRRSSKKPKSGVTSTGNAAHATAQHSTGQRSDPATTAHSTRIAQSEVLPARAGDHHAIQQLLSSVLHRPSFTKFQAQLDDPFYEPSDRLLVKRGDQLIAHAHLVRRSMHFGDNTVPLTIVNEIAVLPELAGEGIGKALLEAVTQQTGNDPLGLTVLRTDQPELLQSQGWCVCLRHSHSVASPREILAQLETVKSAPRFGTPQSAVKVRMWRHVEQAALMRLHAEFARDSFGPLERSTAYWTWLISCRNYDRLYVATRGPDTGALDDTVSPIVGYAVMRDHRILEIVGAADCPDVPKSLLASACRDAIEHDRHYVQLDAAPNDPLHDAFVAAGGERCYYEAQQGRVWMVRLSDPIRFLQSLSRPLIQRARDAGLPVPCELGVRLGTDKYSLTVGPRRLKIAEGRLGRSYLECDRSMFSQLLLGHVEVQAAVSAGRLQSSTRVAKEMAAVLFPQLPIWRPPWDEIAT